MTKARLRSYRALCREVHQLEAKIKVLEIRADSIGSQGLTGMPSGGRNSKSSPIEAAVLSLIDMTQIYYDRIHVLYKEMKEIESAIAELEDSTERQLMRLRYLDGMTWEAICLATGYSWTQTHRIHAKALLGVCKEEEDAEKETI